MAAQPMRYDFVQDGERPRARGARERFDSDEKCFQFSGRRADPAL